MAMARESAVRAVLWAVFGLWLLSLALAGIIDGDIWFHLAGGRYCVQNLRPPVLDPFSYPSAGRLYICLHWLFQLCAYAFYAGFGMFGLVLLKAALVISLAFVIHRALDLSCEDGSLIILFAVVLGCSSGLTIRPLLFSLHYLALCLLIWRTNGRPWWYPLILLFWVNTQGLFILGLLVVGAWMLSAPRQRWRWFALSVAACFVNPYGWRGAVFPFLLYTRIGERNVYSENIQEFTSALHSRFYLATGAGWACLALALAAGCTLIWALREKFEWRTTVIGGLLAAFGLLYILAFRNMAPFAVVAGWVLVSLKPELRRWQARSHLWRFLAVGLLVLAGASMTVRWRLRGHPGLLRRFHGERTLARAASFSVPTDAVAYLDRHDWQGRMLNDFNWGGYLIFRGVPQRKVFIDPRLEVHSREHFAAYVEMTRNPELLDEADRQYDFDLALFCHFPFRGQPAWFRLLHAHPEWHLVYADPIASVFCKRRPNNAALLANPCLPLPTAQEGFDTLRATYLRKGLAGASAFRAPAVDEMYREVGLGQLFCHLGDFRAGLGHLLRAAAAAPGVGDVHFLLACAAADAGDQDLFLRACDYLWIVEPGHPEWQDLAKMGRIRFGLGAR